MKVLFWMMSGFDTHITSEHLLLAVLEQLCEQGHKVHILQKNTGGNLPSVPESVQKYGVTTTTIKFKAPSKTNFVARYIAELGYLKDCIPTLKNGNYDACFIQSNNVAGEAVWLLRHYQENIKITYNVQDIFPYNLLYSGSLKNNLIFKSLAAVQRYAYKNSNSIITVSEDMKDLLIEDGIASEKIKVVYNWSYQDDLYDLEKLDYAVPNRMFDKKYFNVVYAGNIGVMQNVDIIVETAKLMKNNKDVWYHIIGNGVYKEKLQRKAQENEINNISFWSMQPPESAPAIYAAADVNIIPLIKNGYKTALPSKTATCLACRKPIIFAIGKKTNLTSIFKNINGVCIVNSDNAQEIADELVSMMKNCTICDTRDVFKQLFSIKKNSEIYANIITR